MIENNRQKIRLFYILDNCYFCFFVKIFVRYKLGSFMMKRLNKWENFGIRNNGIF